jgi:penicillin-binding protein 1C
MSLAGVLRSALGAGLSALGARLARLSRRRSGRWAFAVGTSIALLVWLRCGPLPPGLIAGAVSESTLVVDRNGVPLYEALSDAGARSTRLTADTIPDLAASATIAGEDRRFWSHYGVDAVAIVRAAKRNLVERRISEGGSTITQQVVKLALLANTPARHRGWGTKIHEAILALRLEHRLTKREILAMYLNLASYGNQITGFERASRAYFGVDSKMLTPAQAAFLAGLPQRPTTFNPYRKQALAQSRQRVVLNRMVAAGALTEAQAAMAREERLNLADAQRPFLAPHFVQMVLANAGDARPGRIQTTLDAGLQEDIAGIIRSHRANLARHGAANVAVVVMDNERGAWLAWEGSGDYLDTDHGGSINGPVAPRQPGSALKALTYALAFEEGFTPASVLPDVPMHFPTVEQGIVYSPRNYDGRYRGPLLARAALAGSENVPAVSLASELGVPKLLRFLHRAGFSTFEKNAAHYGLGVTLGNAEVRLDELVAAYATFARGGQWLAPTYVMANAERESRRLVSPRTAFWITDILSDDAARAYIFGRGSSLEFPFPVAVKTGTSQAYHDNWTIGYTRTVTVGVWVGNFDRRPLRNSSGVTGAAPIFQAVMLAAHRRMGGGDELLTPPDESLSEQDICVLSGERANVWCPSRRREWLPRSPEQPPCSWHHLGENGLMVVWPPTYRDWARQNGLAAGSTPPRLPPTGSASNRGPMRSAAEGAARLSATRATSRRETTTARDLELVNPPPGATYLIDPTLRRDFQTLQLKVLAPEATTIEWSINGVPFSSTSSEGKIEWPLRPGRHTISARDSLGNTAESTITVR